MDEMHEAVTAVLGEIDFDPEELHAKYLSERDKRVLGFPRRPASCVYPIAQALL